jgi:hypothetical protein
MSLEQLMLAPQKVIVVGTVGSVLEYSVKVRVFEQR